MTIQDRVREIAKQTAGEAEICGPSIRRCTNRIEAEIEALTVANKTRVLLALAAQIAQTLEALETNNET